MTSIQLSDLLPFYCFSILPKTTIEETINVELQLLKEIPLDVVLYGKDFTNTVIKEHVESIIFSSDYVEVLLIFILILFIYLWKEILHLHHKYIFLSEGND